jgi:hypothetical protein
MKSILIAEGDERVAELFTDLFGLDGWTVTTYLGGRPTCSAAKARSMRCS